MNGVELMSAMHWSERRCPLSSNKPRGGTGTQGRVQPGPLGRHMQGEGGLLGMFC